MKQQPAQAIITVRLTPRASQNRVEGWRDGALQVRVTAPPADGKANDALLRLLADALSVPVSSLALISGQTARIKRVRVEGLDDAEVRRRLG